MIERVAGTDTREAMATPTVRAAAAAAALGAGPAWVAALGIPAAWRRSLHMPGSLGPWMAVLILIAAAGAGLLAWRSGPARAPKPGSARMPQGMGPILAMMGVALYTAGTGDRVVLALALPAMAVAAGWLVGQCARLAIAASVPDVRSAASGVVIAGALYGLIVSGHIALIVKGNGPMRAAVWSAVYLFLCAVNLGRAQRALSGDLYRLATQAGIARAADARASAAEATRVTTAARARRGDERAEAAGEQALRLEGITVSFGANRVLAGATLSVSAGQVVALVGGNGAGKSTLLRVAAGMIVSGEGRVLVGRDEVTTLLPEERAAAGLAFVSGARPIFPDLTVLENLRVAAYRTHLTARTFDRATDAVFDLVPMLAGRRKARAGVLSGGEQRLLAVAQTLYRRPLVLLSDELSLGLDAHAREAVMDLLRVLADEGVAVVVVDHDLPTLLTRADRAALLAGGVINDYDRPETLLSQRADLLPATFLAGVNG